MRVAFHMNGKIVATIKPDERGIAAFTVPEPTAMVRAELWLNGTFMAGEFYSRDFAPGDTLAVPVALNAHCLLGAA